MYDLYSVREEARINGYLGTYLASAIKNKKGKFKDNQPKINSTPHRENKSAGREYPAERKFSLGGSWHVMSSFSVMNTSHSPSESSRAMSPEVVSPAHPDRPIRPLPKRRLRERLSPDVAESIKYPPAPKTQTPLFYYPYTVRDDVTASTLVESSNPSDRPQVDNVDQNYIPRRNGEDPESEDEEVYRAARLYPRQSADNSGRSYRYVQKPDSKHPNPQPPASTASSADGYDSFENTNNKKKRKIPTPGDSNINGVHLSNDLAGMGISGPDDEDINGAGYYHAGGSASQGLSGPGRGRYGRNRNGRSPLRTLSDASGNWGNGRNSKPRQAQWPTSNDSSGIISTAIANAEKESPITPSRGQENISLLQQQASKKPTPTSTQFTFTCDSQVPAAVPWPGPETTNMHQSPAARSMMTHGTQTSPSMQHSAPLAKQSFPSSQQSAHTQRQNVPQTAPPKRTRRRASREYQIAARQRRQQQEYQNMNHPPNPEDNWILALIRQYERKDRRIRKQEAERKRLLEKAKTKGRKGKKGSKAAAAKGTPQDHQSQHQTSQQGTSADQNHSQETQSEDYPDDEYEQEYAQGHPTSPGARSSLRPGEVLPNDQGRRLDGNTGRSSDGRIVT
ncbi:hypothetical protein EYC84_008112 [Monilinia fructicola]|uniref:Uncharacterized protein n=1 Tax=Monilinia fructicola TaxID=38448 RepID=A0A5M9JI39_MONFR|nr:hypothetical protein EYC84_008112 [Monilinia fructicola]